MKELKKIIIAFLLLAVIFSLAACDAEKVVEETAAEETTIDETLDDEKEIIIRLPGGDWGFPDPFVHQPRDWGGVYTNFIFDSLVEDDETGTIPWLATRWDILDDGKKYVFELRPNVTWHDGAEFTADDVVFTFNYYREKENFIYDLSDVERVIKTGDYSVEFEIKEPSVVIMDKVFKRTPIIPEHIWKNVDDPKKLHTDSPDEAVIGTGPYTLADYQKEHGTYHFKAYDDFWGGVPRVSEIMTIPTQESVLSLLNGEVAITMVSPQEIDMFKDKPEFVIEEVKPYHHKWLCFNLNDPILADIKFRQAMAHAIDRQELLDRMFSGVGNIEGQGGIPKVHPLYNPGIKNYDYSPEKSNQILDELGYKDVDNDGIREDKNGNPLKFTILVMEANARGAELVKVQLQKVGIDVEIKTNDRNTIDDMTRAGKFQIVYQMGGYGGLSGDPDFLARNFTPGASGFSFFSAYGYDNPRINELAAKQRTEFDPKAREKMIFEIQEIVSEEIPLYYLYAQGGYYVYNKEIYDGWFYTLGGTHLDRSKLEYCRGGLK